VKTLLMARLRVMDFKKNSAQKGALQKYEEFMSYARRTSPNSYVDPVPELIVRNTLANLGNTKRDFFDWYYKK